MSYDLNGPFKDELLEFSDVLELINYRPRTKDSYLDSIAKSCQWMDQTYHISLNDASVKQLRAYLAYLHRPVSEGGLGLKPRSVNIVNCALKRYFQVVLKKPLSNNDLPTMRVDCPLPRVLSKKALAELIMKTENIKHRTLLAVAYGCALRLSEVISLRFEDISFSRNLVTIRAENSKNRCEETVELPANLKVLLRQYYHACREGAKPGDWLFPGQKEGRHLSKGAPTRVLKTRLKEIGLDPDPYSFHMLRHAHALEYYLAGADIYQVQVRLRHKRINSTTIYVRLAGKLQERRTIENPFDDPCFKS